MQQSTQQSGVFKRRRTAHACNSCRARKSRCNGAKPVCNMCIEMDFECHYSGPTQHHLSSALSGSRGANSPEYDRRLQTIERALQTIIERSHSSTSSSDGWVRNNVSIVPQGQPLSSSKVASTNSAVVVAEEFGSSSCSRGPDSNTAAAAVSQVDTADSVDGMGSIAFTDEVQAGSFGPTSNSAYLPRLRAALKWLSSEGSTESLASVDVSKTQYAISRPASPPLTAQSAPANIANGRRISKYDLPSHAEAASLVDVFFHNSGQLFPYLSRSHIHDCLSRLSRSAKYDVSRSEFCIVLMVLAFATSVNPNAVISMRSRAAQADKYCRRAKDLLSTYDKDLAGIHYVQASLLVAQYTQGTQKSGETWSLLGRVINLAMKVGIHRERSLARLSPREAESYRRTWWMCFMMDRTQSMTLGRPPLLPNSHMVMNLPSNIDLDRLENNLCVDPKTRRSAPIEETPYGDLFRSSLTLYIILGDIIQAIYFNNLDSVDPELNWTTLQSVFHFEERLKKWRDEVPKMMMVRGLEPESIKTSPRGVRTIFRLRYNSVRTILHRFVLEGLLDSIPRGNLFDADDQTSVECQLIKTSVHLCITSALETLSIIHRATETKDVLPAWWYSIYYTFTSALAILGGIIVQQRHPSILPSYPLSTLIQGAKTALTILQEIGEDTSLGKRCLKFLTKILDSVLVVAQSQSVPRPQGTANESWRQVMPAPIRAAPSDLNDASMASCRQVDFDLSNLSREVMNGISPIDIADCSPINIDLGPFFLGEDLNSFL